MIGVSLFSGAGGMDLGLERGGIRIALQAEIEPRCLTVLERHWPGVVRVHDVRGVDATTWRWARERRDVVGDGPGPDGQRLGRTARGAAGARRPVLADRSQRLWPEGGAELHPEPGELAGGGASGADRHARAERRKLRGRADDEPGPDAWHRYEPDEFDRPDLVAGGFPCQDVSVAGQRRGLSGSRSGLWFEFHRVLRELRPQWVVVENVPGLLTSNDGRDFATILMGLGELGYGWAYRILDARWFGVAQRRRRVFVVGCLGNQAAAQAVLAVCESCGGYPATRGEAGEDVAYALAASARGTGDGHGNAWNSTYVAPDETAATLRSRQASDGQPPDRGGEDDANLVTFRTNQTGAQGPIWSERVTDSLAQDHPPAIAWNDADLVANTLGAGGHSTNPLDETLVAGTLGSETARHPSGLKSEADMLVAGTLGAGQRGVEAQAAWTDQLVTTPVSSKWATTSGGPSGDEVQNLVSQPDPEVLSTNGTNVGHGNMPGTLSTRQDPGYADYVVTHALDAHSRGYATEDGTGRGAPLVAFDNGQGEPNASEDGLAFALSADAHAGVLVPEDEVAHPVTAGFYTHRGQANDTAYTEEASPPVLSTQSAPGVQNTAGVRRLTPLECERLMGWPDGWTAGHPDAHRYRMIGNGVVAPVAQWLAYRLQAVNALLDAYEPPIAGGS